MYEKVGDEEYGIIFIFADGYRKLFAVFCVNYAMNGKGDRRPLIFLYAAVVMRLEKGEISVFVKGNCL